MIGFLFVGGVLSTMIPHVTPITPWTPRTYNVTIGTSPRDMWRPIVHDHQDALNTFVKRFDYLPIPSFAFSLLEYWAENWFVQKEFVAEIKAVAEVSGIRLGKILFLNFMYEYSTAKACSGILARDSFGKILHGRNIDFEFFGMLSKLVVTINYFEKQQIVYSGNYFVGSVFILTGIRHGAYGISEDTRKTDNFLTVLYSLFLGDGVPSPWLIRKVLQKEGTFEAAVRRLNYTTITAPTYYIVSGVKDNQGAVIERDIHGAHGYYQLTEERWYLVQTNYDRDIPDPPKDYRRVPAQGRLQKLTQPHMNQKNLLEKVMMQWPTFNIGTIFTSIIVPHNSYFNTTIWYCAPKNKTTAAANLY